MARACTEARPALKRIVGHIFGKGRKHDKENDIPVYFTDIETINGPPEDATERQTIQLKSRSQLESRDRGTNKTGSAAGTESFPWLVRKLDERIHGFESGHLQRLPVFGDHSLILQET